ncbi:MAG: hypothetical protein ACWGMZ_00765 [Thermoguttaceae bacterium]
MIDITFQNELLEQIAQLPEDLQRQVLMFAKKLKSTPSRGTPGRELLRFVGTITDEDAREMMNAVEAGCEQIDYDEW